MTLETYLIALKMEKLQTKPIPHMSFHTSLGNKY